MIAAARDLTTDRFVRGLAAATAVGLIVRLYVVVIARPTCEPGGGDDCFLINGDALYHFTQARLLGDGHLFKNGLEHLATGRLVPSAGDPPLFATLLGVWSFLGFDTVHWQRVLLTVVGSTTVVLIGLLARRLAGDVAGWIAAGLAAIHPALWINDAMLMSESLYQTIMVVVLFAAVAYAGEPARRAAVWVGVTIGIAALVRGEAALLGVLLLGPLMLMARRRPWPTRVRDLVIAGGVALAVVSPWVIYNNARFEKPVTLTAASGNVLLAGSCDEVWSGPLLGWWADCFTLRDLHDEYVAEFPGIDRPGVERVVYDESLIDTFNREKALDYVGDHLSSYPKVAVARVGRALELFRVGDTLRRNWELEGRWRLPSTVALAMYYALVAPAVAGALLLRREGTRLTPLLSMWSLVIVSAALTFGLTRYRVPVDLAMIVLAAIAGAKLSERYRSGLRSPEAPS